MKPIQFYVRSKLCGYNVLAIIDWTSSRKWISSGLLKKIERLTRRTFTHIILRSEIMVDRNGINWVVSGYIRMANLLTGSVTKFYILEIAHDLLILND